MLDNVKKLCYYDGEQGLCNASPGRAHRGGNLEKPLLTTSIYMWR